MTAIFFLGAMAADRGGDKLGRLDVAADELRRAKIALQRVLRICRNGARRVSIGRAKSCR
jgi:hypothetical protein